MSVKGVTDSKLGKTEADKTILTVKVNFLIFIYISSQHTQNLAIDLERDFVLNTGHFNRFAVYNTRFVFKFQRSI